MNRHSSDNTRTVLSRPFQGRRERERRATASHIKPYYLRLPSLRREFCDEYAHFAWGPDLGLAAASTLASPIYTLVGRCPIQLPNGSWEWRYGGRYLNGSLSGFMTERECLDILSLLQLDVFHALWELYQASDSRPRPVAKSTSSEHLAANRVHALLEVPIGTVGEASPINKEGFNVTEPKYISKKLHMGESWRLGRVD